MIYTDHSSGTEVNYTDVIPSASANNEDQPYITYGELFAEFCKVQDNAKKERNDKYVLSEWLSANSFAMDNPVGAEFYGLFESTLNRFSDNLAQRKSGKTAQNCIGVLRKIQATYLQMLEHHGLPYGFLDAVHEAMRRKGLSDADIHNNVGRIPWNWVRGKCLPQHNKSMGRLHQLEDYLDLPRNLLANKLWAPVSQVYDLSDDIPYRRYLDQVKTIEYRLTKAQMPASLRQSMERLYVHKRTQDHLLPDGSVVTLAPREIWSSDASQNKQEFSLLSFYGFLALPKKPVGTNPDWLNSLRYGLGLDPATFRITMLVQLEYLFPYMQYCELRSFDRDHFLQYEESVKSVQSQQAKRNTIRKSLPEVFLNTFLGLSNNLLNAPHSFFRLNPDIGLELTPPVERKDWSAWCDARQAELRTITTAARKKVKKNKRSNKEVLGSMLREENPTAPYHAMVEAMKRDIHHGLAPLAQAAQWRDLTIISLMLFDPLRAKNITWLDIDKHIVKVNDTYEMHINRSEFKNHIHTHAEDRHRVLPPDVAENLRQWLTVYRPRCVGHDQSNAVFINVVPGGPDKKKMETTGLKETEVTDRFRMTPVHLRRVFVKYTTLYLGVGVGPHALRNLLATTIAKIGGTPAQVKAILNDSEAVANAIYKDVQNIDQMDALNNLYATSKTKVNQK